MRLAVYVVLAAKLSGIASAASLRSGVGRAEEAEEADRQDLASSLWPFHSDDSKSGISFERTDTAFPLFPGNRLWRKFNSRFPLTSSMERVLVTSLAFLSVQYQVGSASQPSPHAIFNDGHCESSDAFGGNVCHYDWGDNIAINYDGWVGQDLDEDTYIEFSAKIDNLVHHSQTCPICGDEPCSINLSAIPNWRWSIKLPPCPLTPESLSGSWKGKLPDKSPLPGILNEASGTIVEGTVWLKKRNDHDNEGDVLLEMTGNVHMK